MTNHNLSIRGLMKSIVPISRFNRGEASKIFEEVSETGVKVVLKNNAPVGVIVNPEWYEEMVAILEDYALYFEAENRMKNAPVEGLISNQQVMETLGISAADMDAVDVEIE
jgi:antitoxin StbD